MFLVQKHDHSKKRHSSGSPYVSYLKTFEKVSSLMRLSAIQFSQLLKRDSSYVVISVIDEKL